MLQRCGEKAYLLIFFIEKKYLTSSEARVT